MTFKNLQKIHTVLNYKKTLEEKILLLQMIFPKWTVELDCDDGVYTLYLKRTSKLNHSVAHRTYVYLDTLTDTVQVDTDMVRI